MAVNAILARCVGPPAVANILPPVDGQSAPEVETMPPPPADGQLPPVADSQPAPEIETMPPPAAVDQPAPVTDVQEAPEEEMMAPEWRIRKPRNRMASNASFSSVAPGFHRYDSILGHRVRPDNGVRYLVKWTGYESDENTWIEQDDFQSPGENLEEYFTSGKVRIISTKRGYKSPERVARVDLEEDVDEQHEQQREPHRSRVPRRIRL